MAHRQDKFTDRVMFGFFRWLRMREVRKQLRQARKHDMGWFTPQHRRSKRTKDN